MGIPTYFLITSMLFHGTIITYSPEYISIASNASAPFYILLAFTAFAWIIELIGIYTKSPTLLGLFAFGHAAVGSWWLVNFAIIFIGGWSYIPLRIMFILLLSILTPAVVWHITGDIIRAHKNKFIEEIAEHTLASQADPVVIAERKV